jgi:hypothetical protein
MALKALAIALYGYGLSFNAIGDLFQVSAEAVRLWVEAFSGALRLPEAEASVIELDEMWHFIQKKKKNAGFGKQYLILLGSYSDSSAVHAIARV